MRRRGFTITELLVVITIIVALAGLILPAIYSAYQKSIETKCLNNLQQLHKGMMMYRDDHMAGGRELNPMRLTHLFSMNYVQNERSFLCPFDDSAGAQGGKPDGNDPSGTEITQFSELDEPIASPRGAVDGVKPCSYMYECAMGAEPSFDWKSLVTLPSRAYSMPGGPDAFVDLEGNISSTKWGEFKAAQMRYGDSYLNPDYPGNPKTIGYSPTKFPVLRCFWHTNNPNSNAVDAIINLAYTGNLFRSGAKWEEATKSW